MKTIKVTVSYPVTFEINIDDLENISTLRDIVLEKADKYFERSTVKPVITDSSMDELVN
jgi:glutathionyl-hydroquinone reductase